MSTSAHPKTAKSGTAATVKDASAAAFIAAYAQHLKKVNWIKLPSWVDLVKTGKSRELAPMDPDWYYIRTASIARKIYLRGGVGIGKLRTVYGGNKRRGPRPERFTPASAAVLRHIVKQLEGVGIVEKHPDGGRRISQDGQQDLDRIAGRVVKAAAAH